MISVRCQAFLLLQRIRSVLRAGARYQRGAIRLEYGGCMMAQTRSVGCAEAIGVVAQAYFWIRLALDSAVQAEGWSLTSNFKLV